MNDIVITFDRNINSEERLKKIIRGIENNCLGYNEIFLVGDKPDWIQGVIHVDFTPSDDCVYINKLNYRKLKAVCFNSKLTENFIWIDADDDLINFNAEKGLRLSFQEGTKDYYRPKGQEVITYSHTLKKLKNRGFGVNEIYFNKYPFSFNKNKLLNTFDDIDFETKYGYCIKTIYAKYNRLKPTNQIIKRVYLQEYLTLSTYEKNGEDN